MSLKLKLILAGIATTALTACGGGSGGGGGSQPVANQDPQGFWEGTSSSGYQIGTVILENGEFYGMFSRNGIAYGADYGTATVRGNTFSGTLQEFYIPTRQVFSATISGSFTPKTTLTGTTTYSNGNVSTGTLTYNTAYDTPASLAQVTGTYTGNYYTGAPVNISISSNGVVSGISNTCNIGGTVAPRPTGKNVYNVNLTFSGSNCEPGVGTASGIGVLNEVSGSTYLYTAGLNSSKTNGFFWIGRKQ
jgi:hypothetical protein